MPGGNDAKGGGGSTSTVNLDTTRLEPTPLETESKQELILLQPFKTDVTTNTSNELIVDLKPVALDLCVTASIGLDIPKALLARGRYVAVAQVSTSSRQFTIVPS